MNLRYRANDMRPHFKVTYSKKFRSLGDQEPLDINAVLQEGHHLPRGMFGILKFLYFLVLIVVAVAFVKESDFEHSSKQVDPNWTPPGTLHDSFEGPDGQYEVWKGNLADPAVKQLNSRVQILVPLFIEGGSYIGQKEDAESSEPDLSDAERWTLFFLYRKDKSTDDASKNSYIFVGYSTIYRFYWFSPTPPPSPTSQWELPSGHTELAELPCRTRLSQFVILPPFQGKGHGARLYKTIFDHYYKMAQTQEFTVEDPNEAFDDLRDICDMTFLRTFPEFNALQLKTDAVIPKSGPLPQLIVGEENLDALQRKSKIASRQFGRVVEMHLMSQLPDSVRQTMDLDKDLPTPTPADKHKEKVWQLIAKQRLYRHNRDALSQLEPEERIDKLTDVLASVELGHARLLAALDRSLQHDQPESTPPPNSKRKADGVVDQGSSKKARVDDGEDLES